MPPQLARIQPSLEDPKVTSAAHTLAAPWPLGPPGAFGGSWRRPGSREPRWRPSHPRRLHPPDSRAVGEAEAQPVTTKLVRLPERNSVLNSKYW